MTGRPADGEGGERPSWGMAKFSRRWISCLLTTGSQGRWQVVPMAMAREAPRKVMPREEGGMRCPQRSLVTLPAYGTERQPDFILSNRWTSHVRFYL